METLVTEEMMISKYFQELHYPFTKNSLKRKLDEHLEIDCKIKN